MIVAAVASARLFGSTEKTDFELVEQGDQPLGGFLGEATLRMQRRDDPHLVVSNVELFDDRHRVKQAPGVYEERMEGGRCRRDSQ